MSDRYYALSVVLEKDMKDEDGKRIIDAIQMLRGVLSVTPHVANIETHTSELRAREELGKKIWAVLYGDKT